MVLLPATPEPSTPVSPDPGGDGMSPRGLRASRKQPPSAKLLPPTDDSWTHTPRTYKASFKSSTPQRLEPVLRGRSMPGGLREGSSAFDRTLARVLGPGTYDPTMT